MSEALSGREWVKSGCVLEGRARFLTVFSLDEPGRRNPRDLGFVTSVGASGLGWFLMIPLEPHNLRASDTCP